MAIYETVQDIVNAIDNALPVIMEGTVGDGIKRLLQLSIKENVYSEPFKPSPYYTRRGTEGGLADTSLMVANYDKGSRELTVYSNARGTYTLSAKALDKMVEEGGPYTYGGNAASPRPFYSDADMYVQMAADTVEKAIIGELEKVL